MPSLQVASPDDDRGQNVATANFLSFVGVILASRSSLFFGKYPLFLSGARVLGCGSVDNWDGRRASSSFC